MARKKTGTALIPIEPQAPGRAGRPSMYRPEMCERVVELGREGLSKAQIARELGVSRKTLYQWIGLKPEFAEAIGYAEDLALAWWEDIGRAGMHAGKNFNATVWIFSLKNRFKADYADRVDTVHTMDATQAFSDMLKAISSGRALEAL